MHPAAKVSLDSKSSSTINVRSPGQKGEYRGRRWSFDESSVETTTSLGSLVSDVTGWFWKTLVPSSVSKNTSTWIRSCTEEEEEEIPDERMPSTSSLSIAAAASSSSSNRLTFNEIIPCIDRRTLGDNTAAVLECPIAVAFFNQDDDHPFFVLEEGRDISKTEADNWNSTLDRLIEANKIARAKAKEDGQQPPKKIKRSSIIDRQTNSFTPFPNRGLINQIRFEDGKVYWIEPIHQKRLGDEGFQNPYFCPLDGHIYDLNSFATYVRNEIDRQLNELKVTRESLELATQELNDLDANSTNHAASYKAQIRANIAVLTNKLAGIDLKVCSPISREITLKIIDPDATSTKIEFLYPHKGLFTLTGVKQPEYKPTSIDVPHIKET